MLLVELAWFFMFSCGQFCHGALKMSSSATFSQQYSGLILLCYELIGGYPSQCELTY